mgnify:CR=1 FL=1
MNMEKKEFDFLVNLIHLRDQNICMKEEIYEICERRGYVKNGKITVLGQEALEPYRVKNAIIMAAGYSARCMPLSNIVPKGLFRVKGEILIEREIRQLMEAGINDILIITGFMQEKFAYLNEKYGVKLICNEMYKKYNNLSSLYAAKDYIDRSYILCCDNYYETNVFLPYVYQSYYYCLYPENYCDEFCVTEVDENGIIKGIHRGGSHAWYTIGDAYFDHIFSEKFVYLMSKDWEIEKNRNQLMDDFHIKHITELPLYQTKREKSSIWEFDTLEEIYNFDKDFKKYVAEKLDLSNVVNQIFFKYADIKPYHSVPTDQLSGRLHLNENLFKPSPRCMEVFRDIEIEDLYLYDLGHEDELLTAISRNTGISENNLFIHNGSSEVIKSIGSILLNEGDIVLLPSPGWSYYKSVADAKFARCIAYEVTEKSDRYEYNVEDILKKAKEYRPKIIILTSPQMPTGCEISKKMIEKIISSNENSIVLLDEAYWGYEDVSNCVEKELITQYSNVVITRTFSKFYGLAGIRLGYGLCSYPLRKTIGLDLPLFRASGICRKIAAVAIEDVAYYDQMRAATIEAREWFIDELNHIEGVKAFKSGSNFVFVKLAYADADIVRAFMEENNILIRLFTDKEALRLRITIAPKDVLRRVIFQLERALKIPPNA